MQQSSAAAGVGQPASVWPAFSPSVLTQLPPSGPVFDKGYDVVSRSRRCLASAAQHFCIVAFILAIVIAVVSVIGFMQSGPTRIALDPAERSSSTNSNGNSRFGSLRTHGARLDNSTENLFWFVQVSDLHLSKFYDHPEIAFRYFCNTTLPTIRPAFVIASGDLTDSFLDNTVLRPGQVEAEWQTYRNILQEHNLLNSSFWIDLRGNHDYFSVPTPGSAVDYFPRYGVQGRSVNHTQRVFTFVHNTTFGQYRFVFLDATPDVGVVFNFFGILSQSMVDQLQAALSNQQAFNHTFFIGHYPFFAMGRARGLATDISDVASRHPYTASLVGHLHMREQYARLGRDRNLLELELGDLKVKSLYRILAIDSDLFSFTDTEVTTWPAVVLTNPKDARFLSEFEPLERIRNSSHIRVLVFSPAPIQSARVRITSNSNGTADDASGRRTLEAVLQRVGDTPLYVAPWRPADYAHGLHDIEVVARDAAGRETVLRTQFSTDGSIAPIAVAFPTWLQHVDGEAAMIAAFVIFLTYGLVWLLILPRVVRIGMRGRPEALLAWERRLTIMCAFEAGLLPSLIAMSKRSSSDGGTQNPSTDTAASTADDTAGAVVGEPSGARTISQRQLRALVFNGPAPTLAELRHAFSIKNIIGWQPQMTVFNHSRIPLLQVVPLIVAGVWIALLPWLIGDVAGAWGSIFTWGAVSVGGYESTFIQTGLAVIWLLAWYIPLIFLLAAVQSAIMRSRLHAVLETNERTRLTYGPQAGARFLFDKRHWFRGAWAAGCLLLVVAAGVFFNVLVIVFNVLAWLLSPVIFWYGLLVVALVLHALLHRQDAFEADRTTPLLLSS